MDVKLAKGWWTQPDLQGLNLHLNQGSGERQDVTSLVDKNTPGITEHLLDIAVRTLREFEVWVERFHGAELTGLNLKVTEDGWLAIVKADYRGRPVVAFCHGDTLAETLVYTAYLTSTKGLKWRKDKYPSK